jgi:molybdopterin molybdotransferase
MVSIDDALNIVLAAASPLEAVRVPILSALDRVLAENVCAPHNLPPFTNAAVDGFAVETLDVSGANSEHPALLMMVGEVAAGVTSPRSLRSGECIKVMTGAPLPAGADAVVMVETTRRRNGKVEILAPVQKDENVRFAGEDIKQGQIVFEKGTCLRPPDIAMLAALGKAEVQVAKQPFVAIVVTGNELIEPGEPLAVGKTYNADAYGLAAQVRHAGAFPLYCGIAGDSIEAIRDKFTQALQADIVLITGGVSRGDYDFVKPAMQELGAKLQFWEVTMKPARPTAFWTFDNKLVFGMPGNPVAAMLAFEIFVQPAIERMLGKRDAGLREIEATMVNELKKKPGRAWIVRVKVVLERGQLLAQVAGPQGSGIIRSMMAANGLAILSEPVEKVSAGEKIRVRLVDEIAIQN